MVSLYLQDNAYEMNRIDSLLNFLKESPKDSFIQFALALEYIKNGDPDTGLQYFEGLVVNDPDYVGTYYHLAKLYIQLERADDAAACFDKGIAIAKKLNDQHSLAELQNAALNLKLGLTDED